MARIDCLIFGYRSVCIGKEDVATASGILLREGISSDISDTGVFEVRERDLPRLKALLFAKGIEYSVSEMRGMRGWIKSLRYRLATVIALAVAVLLNIFLSSLIWDVRISGNEVVSDERIATAIRDAGLGIGSIWLGSDISDVEAGALDVLDEVSWISINRRGTVLYVEVMEREGISVPQPSVGYANVIASRDCVIEEITVKRGVATVKAGDVVKAGQLLISGVIPDELGGGFCYAEGSVKGTLTDTVEVLVPATEEHVLENIEELDSAAIRLFGFSINIFKKYGKVEYDYGIIENEKVFRLFGRYTIPFGIVTRHRTVQKIEVVEYTSAEMTALASLRLSERVETLLSGSDLKKISTSGDFTDDGYRMASRVVYSAEVGISSPFTVE